MVRPKLDIYFDGDDRGQKTAAMSALGTCRGMQRMTVTPVRPTRSLRQNASYWALVVEPFRQFLRDQELGAVDRDYAHRIIVAKILGTVPVIDPATGEVLANEPRPTKDLSVEEFSDFVERARAWLADMFHIVT